MANYDCLNHKSNQQQSIHRHVKTSQAIRQEKDNVFARDEGNHGLGGQANPGSVY